MTVLSEAVGRTENAGNETNDGVRHQERRQFTAGHDEIADAAYVRRVERTDPVVDPLVSTTNEHHLVSLCQFGCSRLGEDVARRVGEDDGEGRGGALRGRAG